MICSVTSCLENLEMSGNLTVVSDMSGILLKLGEVSGKCLEISHRLESGRCEFGRSYIDCTSHVIG